MKQITFVAKIITVIEAINVMLENTLTLPNLHDSHKIHNVCKSIYPVCYYIKGVMKGTAIRFCARTEITVNAVNPLTVPYD